MKGGREIEKLPRKVILNLEQFQCQACGRSFYINEYDGCSIDTYFGCPYGCDGIVKFARAFYIEITKQDKRSTIKNNSKRGGKDMLEQQELEELRTIVKRVKLDICEHDFFDPFDRCSKCGVNKEDVPQGSDK